MEKENRFYWESISDCGGELHLMTTTNEIPSAITEYRPGLDGNGRVIEIKHTFTNFKDVTKEYIIKRKLEFINNIKKVRV